MVRPGDVVMVVEQFADDEGQIGIVESVAHPDIWGDRVWVIFGRDEPAIDAGSDRYCGLFPPSSLLIIGTLGVMSDMGRALMFDLSEPPIPAGKQRGDKHA